MLSFSKDLFDSSKIAELSAQAVVTEVIVTGKEQPVLVEDEKVLKPIIRWVFYGKDTTTVETVTFADDCDEEPSSRFFLGTMFSDAIGKLVNESPVTIECTATEAIVTARNTETAIPVLSDTRAKQLFAISPKDGEKKLLIQIDKVEDFVLRACRLSAGEMADAFADADGCILNFENTDNKPKALMLFVSSAWGEVEEYPLAKMHAEGYADVSELSICIPRTKLSLLKALSGTAQAMIIDGKFFVIRTKAITIYIPLAVCRFQKKHLSLFPGPKQVDATQLLVTREELQKALDTLDALSKIESRLHADDAVKIEFYKDPDQKKKYVRFSTSGKTQIKIPLKGFKLAENTESETEAIFKLSMLRKLLAATYGDIISINIDKSRFVIWFADTTESGPVQLPLKAILGRLRSEHMEQQKKEFKKAFADPTKKDEAKTKAKDKKVPSDKDEDDEETEEEVDDTEEVEDEGDDE